MTAEQRREQILTAAHRMLDERPLEQISVEAVAAEVAVSPGLLFHYFGTQRQFRRAVIETAAADLLAQMNPDPAQNPLDQVHAALDTFTAAVASQPAIYLAVVRSTSDLSGVHETMRTILGDWLRAGLEQAGILPTPAVSVTLAGWLAFTEAAITSWLTAERRLTREGLVTLCEQALLRLLEAAAAQEEVANPVRWAEIERRVSGQLLRVRVRQKAISGGCDE